MKKVFVSSACYNLKDLRAEIAKEVESLGYKAIWNESPDFPVEQGVHSHDSCLDAVKECDIYVLIIDSRYGGLYAGSKYPKKDISITQYEAEIAVQCKKEIYTFVREEIWNERPTFKKNQKKGVKIEPFHVDNEKVYEFIEFMNNQKNVSNWISSFKNSVEMKEMLRAKLKKDGEVSEGTQVNNAQSIDISLLKEINKVFTGNAMHLFFETLSDSECVYLEQVIKFDNSIKRYLAPDKKLRNELIENTKRDFLISLDKFLAFGGLKFNPLPNGILSKFYGGISEYDIIKNHDNYEKDHKKFLKLARDVFKKWTLLQGSIMIEIPYYKWK